MRPFEAFDMARGRTPFGWTLIEKVDDDTRDMSIFKDMDNNLAFGFGPTKGEFTGPDWRENFRILPKAEGFGVGMVHSGFLDQTKLLVDKVCSAIEIYRPNEVGLYGFSQGGAIAGLMFRMLSPRTSAKLDGMAFGTPPWLDSLAKHDFNKILKMNTRTFRLFKAWGDPVPLSTKLIGYHEAGIARWIGPYHFWPNLKFPSPIHNGDYYARHLNF